MRGALVIAMALVLGACGRPFDPANLILTTRVIGARVDVAGDPGRATAVPGESVTVRYLVVSPPATSDPLTVASVSCVQASSAGIDGLTGCAGSTFGATTTAIVASARPMLEVSLTIPSDVTPGLSTYVLTYVGLCVDGTPSPVIDVTTATVECTDGAAGLLFQSTLRLSPDARLTNRNPTLDDETYALDAMAWTEPDPTIPATGCAAMAGSSALPLVQDSATAPTLHFGCSPDDRESYPAFDADMRPIMAREDLDIGHFVTAGSMDGSTRITSDDTNDVAMTTWTPPGDAPIDGELVRFWFVARDRRGGEDWVERDLCVVPSPGDGGASPGGRRRGCGCVIVGESGGGASIAMLAACIAVVCCRQARRRRG